MKRKVRNIFMVVLIVLSYICTMPATEVSANSYSGDYRYWSQGGSDYIGMREVGCLITAQAKMLYEANVIRDAGFNPDQWYLWLLNNGYIASSNDLNMRDHKAPVYFANSIGKNLEYLGYWEASDAQLWFNINAGYYTILHVSGTNTGGHHYVLIDNELSKSTGQIYCYDSFSDRGSVSEQLITRYSIHNGGLVYKANNPTHTHSYSSMITKEPNCTEMGVRVYSCSCGDSYTESIPSKGHLYVDEVVEPTLTEQGYTIHICSVCQDRYVDNYINPPQKDSDGWYYCEALPLGINKDNYTIQYNNYYEKVQSNSPGSDWNNAGVVRNEWQNTGSTYTSSTDLPTSDARILVRSYYYHFCGPNSGAEANYEIAGVFTHYDSVDASQVTGQYLGDDNGHPYYFIYWPDGNQVYCSSGVTCDGSFGSHGARSRAWYKENTYQDRVNIVIYKFTKESGWVDSVSSDASSYGIRFKEKDCSVSGEHTYETVVVAANATTKTKGTITKQCTVCGDIAAQKAVNYPKNIILSESEFIYDGKIKSPTVTITDSAGKTIDSKHYDIVMSPGRKNVGRYDCTVNFKGKYYTGSINTTFTIVPKATGISSLSNASDGIIIKWKTNSQATGYKIYKSADGKNYKRIAIIKGKDTVSYVDKDQLINGEKYYYKICAYKNDAGVAITSADSSIKAIYRLDRTILATVTPVVGKLSVQWETNSKATGYEIQYSLDSKFTTVIGTVVMTKGTSYRKTILDLVSGQRYYVRVRAYKEVSGKTYYSAWSSPMNAVVR